ncbi:MAG: hypothetical protein RL308_2558 [Bacteroidota bacterium]|jgi:hypothetical protein
MKTLFGIGFIILGIVTLFRYPYGEVVGFPELMGVLIGFGIIILPGILLIRSDNKNKSNTDEK